MARKAPRAPPAPAPAPGAGRVRSARWRARGAGRPPFHPWHPGVALGEAMEARVEAEGFRDAGGKEHVQRATRHPRQDLAEHDEPDVAVRVAGARPAAPPAPPPGRSPPPPTGPRRGRLAGQLGSRSPGVRGGPARTAGGTAGAPCGGPGGRRSWPRPADRRLGHDAAHRRVGTNGPVPPERQERRRRREDLGQGREVEDRAERRAPRRALEDAPALVEHDRRRAGKDARRDPLVEERLKAGAGGHPTRFCFRAR